jgi:hypothetical protein
MAAIKRKNYEDLIDFIADSKDDMVGKSSGKAAKIAVPIFVS